MIGSKTIGYITKFMIQSINAHPDFLASTIAMIALPAGTDEITLDSGHVIGAVTTQSVTPQLYTNVSVTYIPGSGYSSEVNFPTYDQSFSVIENNISKVTPDLP